MYHPASQIFGKISLPTDMTKYIAHHVKQLCDAVRTALHKQCFAFLLLFYYNYCYYWQGYVNNYWR